MTTPGTESILVTVDIATNEKRVAELTKSLTEAKAAMQALTKANAEGRLSSDDLTVAGVRYKAQAAAITGEIKLLTKANADQVAANKAAAGSVDELKAKSALLTTQYNALSEAERTGTDAGQKLGAELKKTNDALKATGAAVSDTRRSVGSYNEGIKDVNVVSGQLTGGLKTAVSQGLAPFQSQLDRGAGLFGKFKSGADLVKTGLAALKPAGEEGAGGFKAVAAGIALTGLGVFLLVLGSVISYFTSTNEGGKILKQGLAALGAVVTTVANTFTGAGKALVQAFKDPKVALESLMGFLKDQVVNRLAAFGLLIDGIRNRDFKKITDSVIQFSAGITNGTDKINDYAKGVGKAATNAGELEAQFQALKKSRAGLEADEILEKGRVEVLIRLSKDRTQSAGERLNKLREAGRLEEELSAKSLKQTTAELTAFKERNAAKGLSRTADDIQEERDKQKEYNNTVVERNNTLATIKARQSRFILEERAELLKDQKERTTAAQTAREQAVKVKQTEVEQLLLTVAKGSAAELALLQKKIDLAAALTLASEKKTAADRALILATADAEKNRLQEEFNQKAVAEAKKHTAETLTEALREYAEAQQLLENHLNDKRAAIERDYAAGKISQSQYEKDINAIDKAGNAAALVNAKDYGKANGALLKKQADDEIKEGNRVKNEKKKIKDAEQTITDTALAAGIAASNAVIGLLGEESTAGQAALAIRKTLALAEIGINLQKQLSLNAVAAAALNVLLPGSGIVYKITADVLSITEAAAGSAKILGFATGGYVSGAGTGTSDSIPSMLSNGESVNTAASTAMFAPLLSYLNVLGGGVPIVTPNSGASRLNDGGLSARAAAGGAGLIDYQQLASAIAQQPISVDVRAITTEQGRVARPRRLAKLG